MNGRTCKMCPAGKKSVISGFYFCICFSVCSSCSFDSLFLMNESAVVHIWKLLWSNEAYSIYLSVSVCLLFCASLCLSWWKMTHAAHRVCDVWPHPSLICSLCLLSLSSGCAHLLLSVLSGEYQKSCTECEPCPAGSYTTERNREDSCHRCYGDCRPGKETMSHFYLVNSFLHPCQDSDDTSDLCVSIIKSINLILFAFLEMTFFFCD